MNILSKFNPKIKKRIHKDLPHNFVVMSWRALLALILHRVCNFLKLKGHFEEIQDYFLAKKANELAIKYNCHVISYSTYATRAFKGITNKKLLFQMHPYVDYVRDTMSKEYKKNPNCESCLNEYEFRIYKNTLNNLRAEPYKADIIICPSTFCMKSLPKLDNNKLKFKIPKPTTLNRFKNCKDAITEPPINSDCPNHDFTKQSTNVIKRLKHIKPGENAWTADLPENLKLNVKGAKLSMIYKRLDPEKPAYTITGSGGGGTHVYHWIENRALTNRERARLQTFPDDFIFHGSKESVRRQIGMAVPVDGVRYILEAILKTFANVKYASIESNTKIEYDDFPLFNQPTDLEKMVTVE